MPKPQNIIGYKGGKGGGGSGRVAQEAPDSLKSRAFARVLDLLCEGEIEGLVDGLKSIFLDGTPIQNTDGSYNFTGINYATRNGTQGQTYIQGFPGAESENLVQIKVTTSVPVVRTILDSEVNAVRVRVSTPQLTSQDTTNGDINGTEVQFKISIQADGGGYVEFITDSFNGKTTSKYERSYLIPLDGGAPYDVKLERITADSLTVALQNDIYFEAYTEIINAKLSYPNSALVGAVIDSQQFQNIPLRSYHCKLKRVQIPSNYNPVTRVYTGVWDGLFTIAWTNNPAWCFYDLITEPRYGLGQFIDADQVDKWALYEIGKYCDELVPDGFGSTEPRFACNVYWQTQAEAFKVLQDMASIFRGMIFWQTGAVTAIQDAPSDAAFGFTNANVIDGLFNYSGTSLKTRHTVALVSWNDPADFYNRKVEYVENRAGIERFGVIETSITAVGCTSRGQAHRVGKWLLYSEYYETETVSFGTGAEGAIGRPGQVIKIHDQNRVGARLGGRIVSATSTSVTVDNAFTPIDGETYTLFVNLPDGTIEEKTVASIVGNVINITGSFSQTLQKNTIWMISSEMIEPQTFRIVSVTENEKGYEVVALEHNPDKYALIEQDIILTPVNTSLLTQTPASPASVNATESLYASGAEVASLIDITASTVLAAVAYEFSWKRDNGNINIIPATAVAHAEIRRAEPGFYTISCVAIGITGKRSLPATTTIQVLGKTAPPGDVQNLNFTPLSGTVGFLTWDLSVDLDVLIGGYVRLRYSPVVDGSAEWNNSVDIGPALAGNARNATVPLVNGTYLAKFIDSSGISSVTEAIVITTASSLINLNVVETITESPDFTGVKTNCAYSSDFGGLVLAGVELFDSYTDVDAEPDWDFGSEGIVGSGTYDFASTFDMGATYIVQLSASMKTRGVDIYDLIDSRLTEVDSWADWDGANIDDVNATLYVRQTNDDPSGSPVWSEWQPFFVGSYTARAFQFQLRLTSEDSSHTIVVEELEVVVDVPDRVEGENNIISGATTYTVTFPNAFWDTPAIGVTPRNMATKDYFERTNETEFGFDIVFKNEAGTVISRTFDYIAKGFGYKV